MRPSPPLRLAALAAAVAALPAAAQPEPQRLPDLTPRVFTIEGDVEAALPTIERQPLTGFGPPPRAYLVPAGREPATGRYGPDLTGLGAPTLPAPAPPAIDLAAGRFGRVAGGAGRYFARFGRLDLALPLGDAGRAGTLVADVDYDGLGTDGAADYVTGDRIDARGGWRGAGRIRPSLDGGFLQHTYALPLIDVERTARRFDVGARVDGEEAPARGVGFAVGARYAAARLGDDATAAALTEGRLDAEARLELAGGRLRLDGAVGTAGRDAGLGSDLVHYAAGGAIHLGRADGARIALGARALGYEASFANGSGRVTVAAPTVLAELPVGPAATFFARTEGRIVRRGLADLFEENPFVESAPILAPDVVQADAAAGVAVRAGALGLRLAAEGAYYPTRAVFERGAGNLFTVSYERARTLGGGADLTLVAPSGAEAGAGVRFRTGRLTETDDEIPYLPSVEGHLGVQVPFAGDRGRAGLAGAVWGPRPTTRFGGATLPTAGALTLDAGYRVTGGLGLTLRATHLLGRAERWDGYPQAPFTVALGAQYVW